MNEDELVGDVVIPKVSSGNSNNQNEDLLPLGYEALPRSASTVRRFKSSESPCVMLNQFHINIHILKHIHTHTHTVKCIRK